MINSNQLTGAHLRAYDKIFQHPVTHNLDWHEVSFLLDQLGHISNESNGHLKMSRNGHSHFFPGVKTSGIMSTEEVLELRHFLERSDTPAPEAEAKEAHWVVVIDHHEARIFRSEIYKSVPHRILPHRPEDYFRHAHNLKDFSRGQEKPDANSFFGPIALALKGAEKILVIGSGKGTGSEMEQFLGWLPRHHSELARQVIGSLVVDQHHLTEAQILAKAREFYTNLSAAKN
jgi:hypothetical protein